jgi:hypothetical protein
LSRNDLDDVLLAAGMGALGLWYALLVTYGIINMVWTYKFWSWIPPEQRHTSMWNKYISPGSAVAFMFIPYFNLYWMFVIHLGIAEILDRMRLAYPTTKGSPRNAALVATIGSMLFFPVGPFLHWYFDKQVETLALEMRR